METDLYPLHDLCAALGLAIFIRHGEGEWTVQGSLPQWWAQIDRDAEIMDQGLGVVGQHPFVRHFLEDARAFWLQSRPGRIDSGIWEYERPGHDTAYLQLHAVHCQNGTQLLVIQDLEATGVRLHAHLQRGREMHLRTLEEAHRRERLEAELQRARDAAQRLDRTRMEFLANVSHELRTPVTSILGLSELAADSGDMATQREYLDAIRQSATHLLKLVNDLLDASRIETGNLEIRHAPFSLVELLRALQRSFESLAEAKGLSLQVELKGDLQEMAYGSETRLQQVLSNLLDNAIKFTDSGQVVLRVTRSSDRPAWVQFAVVDTGPGIPSEYHQFIFDSFCQVDTSMNRRFGGAGLGLSVAGQLTVGMGGRLELESVVGQGSSFHFELPLYSDPSSRDEAQHLAPQVEVAARTPPSTCQAPLRILVAEDNAMNRLFLRRALAKSGHQVWEAEHGLEALAHLEREDVDLVILDAQMPQMDGLEAVRRIRERERSRGGYLPVLVISAHVTPQLAARYRDAGIEDYLCKPFTVEELLSKVATVSRLKRSSLTTLTENSGAASSSPEPPRT